MCIDHLIINMLGWFRCSRCFHLIGIELAIDIWWKEGRIIQRTSQSFGLGLRDGAFIGRTLSSPRAPDAARRRRVLGSTEHDEENNNAQDPEGLKEWVAIGINTWGWMQSVHTPVAVKASAFGMCCLFYLQ